MKGKRVREHPLAPNQKPEQQPPVQGPQQVLRQEFAEAYQDMLSKKDSPDAFIEAYKKVKILYNGLPPQDKKSPEELSTGLQVNAPMIGKFIAAENVFGYGEEYTGGKPLFEVNPKEDTEGILKLHKEHVEDQQVKLQEFNQQYNASMDDAIQYCLENGLMEADANGKVTKKRDATSEEKEQIQAKFAALSVTYGALSEGAKGLVSPEKSAKFAPNAANTLNLDNIVGEINRSQTFMHNAKERQAAQDNSIRDRFNSTYSAVRNRLLSDIQAGNIDYDPATGKLSRMTPEYQQEITTQLQSLRKDYDKLSAAGKEASKPEGRALMESSATTEELMNGILEESKSSMQHPSDTTKELRGPKGALAKQILDIAGFNSAQIDDLFTKPEYESQRKALLKRTHNVISKSGIGKTNAAGKLEIDEDKLRRNPTTVQEKIKESGVELAAQAGLHSKWTSRGDVRTWEKDGKDFKKSVRDGYGNTEAILGALEREDQIGNHKWKTKAKDLGKGALSLAPKGVGGLIEAPFKLTGKGLAALGDKMGKNKKKTALGVAIFLVLSMATGGVGGVILGAVFASLFMGACYGAKKSRDNKKSELESFMNGINGKSVDTQEITQAIEKEKELARAQERAREAPAHADERAEERGAESTVVTQLTSGGEFSEEQNSTSVVLTAGDKDIIGGSERSAGREIEASAAKAERLKGTLQAQKEHGHLSDQEFERATKIVEKTSAQATSRAVTKVEKIESAVKDNRKVLDQARKAFDKSFPQGEKQGITLEDVEFANRKAVKAGVDVPDLRKREHRHQTVK